MGREPAPAVPILTRDKLEMLAARVLRLRLIYYDQ